MLLNNTVSTKYTDMPIAPTISYDHLDDSSPEEISALQKHEASLVANLVVLTGTSYEKYEWIRDKSAKSQRYLLLRCHSTGEAIISRSIKEIAQSDSEDLISKIAFEAADKEQNKKKDQ